MNLSNLNNQYANNSRNDIEKAILKAEVTVSNHKKMRGGKMLGTMCIVLTG